MPTPVKRFVFGAMLLLSVLFLPFWLSVVIAFLGMLLFKFYLEAVFLLFLSDLLYGTREARFLHILFLSSSISLVALLLLEILKKKLKFYNETLK